MTPRLRPHQLLQEFVDPGFRQSRELVAAQPFAQDQRAHRGIQVEQGTDRQADGIVHQFTGPVADEGRHGGGGLARVPGSAREAHRQPRPAPFEQGEDLVAKVITVERDIGVG